VLPELKQALKINSNTVLTAPPGAGKTTRVPLALLEEPWLAGQKIIMLEPRRVAARSSARYMAKLLGEETGQTVGYRIRGDALSGPDTRIEVVTEGVLTRMLQTDPGVSGVGLIIFDEYHERSLHADLGLALCLQAQALLRDDLRLLVMSATLDGEAVADLLGDAPIVRSEGRSYPVETRYLNKRLANGPIEPAVAAVVREAVAREEGDLLVFLPGAGEIRRTQGLLADLSRNRGVLIVPLYGDLSQESQDKALRLAEGGGRRIVLATSIAETSLTVEGVRVVIDSGLARVPRFSPRTGMTRLITVPVSRDSADQRRGRAGRVAPGVCYRLWTAEEEQRLPERSVPEILAAELAAFALELAVWGVRDPAELRWLDPPPAGAWAQACALLRLLGALDAEGGVTPAGRRMAALGLHPRLARMLLAAPRRLAPAACRLAALLGERDLLRSGSAGGGGPAGAPDADLRSRVRLLASGGAAAAGADPAAMRRLAAEAARLARQLGVPLKAAAASAAQRASAPSLPAAAQPAASAASPTTRPASAVAPSSPPASPATRPVPAVAPPALAASAPSLPAAAQPASSAASSATPSSAPADEAVTGLLLAFAYPDRIAQKREDGRYLLSGGRGAYLHGMQLLSGARYLVAAELDDLGPDSRIYLAAPVELEELVESAPELIRTESVVEWDAAIGAVRSRNRTRLGALVLQETPAAKPDPELVRAVLIAGIQQAGLTALPWSRDAAQLLQRIRFMHRWMPDYPDLSDDYLLGQLELWLGPHLEGKRSLADLARLNLTRLLEEALSWEERRQLITAAPTHIVVPSGSRLPVDYSDPEAPYLAVRLQEMFGLRDTPRIADGRVTLVLQLLSPAQRPVQVTRDLAGFWRDTYFEVRKDLKGRYPKHEWPDDPLIAPPTSRAKRRNT
jgi:ATP-dependent helicase HrpB